MTSASQLLKCHILKSRPCPRKGQRVMLLILMICPSWKKIQPLIPYNIRTSERHLIPLMFSLNYNHSKWSVLCLIYKGFNIFSLNVVLSQICQHMFLLCLYVSLVEPLNPPETKVGCKTQKRIFLCILGVYCILHNGFVSCQALLVHLHLGLLKFFSLLLFLSSI